MYNKLILKNSVPITPSYFAFQEKHGLSTGADVCPITFCAQNIGRFQVILVYIAGQNESQNTIRVLKTNKTLRDQFEDQKIDFGQRF
jgi:hypothetical protein